MARPAKKLAAAFVRSVTTPGKYYDQFGLHLRVWPSGAKQWLQRIAIHGKRRELGLGSYPLYSLAQARDKAMENLRIARDGGDPIAQKRRHASPTFAQAAEKVIAIQRAGWTNGAKSEAQWRQSLTTYVYPTIGDRPVSAIQPRDVLELLVPIWHTKPETARRVRQRVSAVMKWSVVHGYRKDDPAGDVLAPVLAKQNGVKNHHKALSHAHVAQALAKVAASAAWTGTKLAFQFLVLTAARSKEVRLATWQEIDLKAATWTVPASRMKAKREHRVPLSTQALEVLQQAREIADHSGLIFPSLTGRALADATTSKLIRELGINAVPHGFRSSFRDWSGETGQPREVAEASLAHTIQNQAEAAYARSDLFNRRRRLMQDWAAYVTKK